MITPQEALDRLAAIEAEKDLDKALALRKEALLAYQTYYKWSVMMEGIISKIDDLRRK